MPPCTVLAWEGRGFDSKEEKWGGGGLHSEKLHFGFVMKGKSVAGWGWMLDLNVFT